MQLRWVFNTKNTYDIISEVDRQTAYRFNDLFVKKKNGDPLTAADINSINRSILNEVSNTKTLGDLVKRAPSFEVPFYPTNVTVSYKDIELYIRRDATTSWILVYANKKFNFDAFNSYFDIIPPNVEEIKSNILAQIDELLNH